MLYPSPNRSRIHKASPGSADIVVYTAFHSSRPKADGKGGGIFLCIKSKSIKRAFFILFDQSQHPCPAPGYQRSFPPGVLVVDGQAPTTNPGIEALSIIVAIIVYNPLKSPRENKLLDHLAHSITYL